jgi:hypothetical protein
VVGGRWSVVGGRVSFPRFPGARITCRGHAGRDGGDLRTHPGRVRRDRLFAVVRIAVVAAALWVASVLVPGIDIAGNKHGLAEHRVRDRGAGEGRRVRPARRRHRCQLAPGRVASTAADQAGVGIRDRQRDPGQSAGHQSAQERQPAGAVLTETTSSPRTSRCPPAVTPTVIRACTITCGRARGPSGSARPATGTCTARRPPAGTGTPQPGHRSSWPSR